MLNPWPINRDVFAGWEAGDGIFQYLTEVAIMPWSENALADSETLDLEYFGNHSGSKLCTPLVVRQLNSDGELPSAARRRIAKIIAAKYLPAWNALWRTNTAEYNPIHNYDMTETRRTKTSGSKAETGIDSIHDVSSDTKEYGKVETTEHGRTSDSTLYKYGLNTEALNPKPSDAESLQEGGETVLTNSGSDEGTRDSQRNSTTNLNSVEASAEDEELRRFGNIGVTTTQQMLKAERDLWKWNFFEQIFKDLDNELCLSVHDICRV